MEDHKEGRYGLQLFLSNIDENVTMLAGQWKQTKANKANESTKDYAKDYSKNYSKTNQSLFASAVNYSTVLTPNFL